MSSLTFASAAHFPVDELSTLFTRAYTAYYVPVRLDAAGFESMAATYDIDLRASRVGLLGRTPIAIALLGVRGSRGWIGGMGVVPAHRGERVGLAAMQAVIGSARGLGLRSIQLEVLTQNLPALRIYKALGFRRKRVLDIWTRDSDATFPLPPHQDVQPIDVGACLALFDELHTVAPPWQRDLPVLQRIAPHLHGLGIHEGGRTTAYLLYRVDGVQVSVLDAAAAPSQRTAAIEALLRVLIRDRSGSGLRFVNVPQDDPASDAMRRISAEALMQQDEMTLEL